MSYISFIRGFRLLKIFKFAEMFSDFNKLLDKVSHTIVDILFFILLLLIFLFVYALLGVELFKK